MQSISSLFNQAPLHPQQKPVADDAPAGSTAAVAIPEQAAAALTAPQAVDFSRQGRLLAESYAYSSQYEQKNTGSIEVYTQDGDRLEISFSSQYESRVEKTFQQDASGQSSSVLQQQTARMSFQLSVQGSLDEAEQEAIQSLMNELGELASDFYEGDLDAAIQSAMSLQLDATELKSLSVSLKQSSQLEVAQQYQRTAQLSPSEVRPEEQAEGPAEGPGQLVALLAELQQWLEAFNEQAGLDEPVESAQRLMKQMLAPLDETLSAPSHDYLGQLLDQAFDMFEPTESA